MTVGSMKSLNVDTVCQAYSIKMCSHFFIFSKLRRQLCVCMYTHPNINKYIYIYTV
jgi:hypothetical protein